MLRFATASLVRATVFGSAIVAVAAMHSAYTAASSDALLTAAATETGDAPLGTKGDRRSISTATIPPATLDVGVKEARLDTSARPGFALAALPPEEALAPASVAPPSVPHAVTVDAATRREIEASVSTFVWGMSNGVADAVWNFALEEEQDWLGTSAAALDFFSRLHPALAKAKSLSLDGVASSGEITTAGAYIRDADGTQWHATFELVRDDAGSWRIMNIQTDVAPGELI